MRWLILLAVGCAAGPSGPGGPCPPGPLFTELPVDQAAIAWTTTIGGFSPPAHTLPSDHAGIYLAGQGVALRAPGPLVLTSIRRTRYLSSPFRTGAEDYALDLHACADVRVSLGHLVTLSGELLGLIQSGNCQQYSTANETVEACYTNLERPIAAGAFVGTVGGATAPAFDFGVYDRRRHNTFANPARYHEQMIQAVCPWELFREPMRTILLSRVGAGSQRRMGESACGTMEVDRPGSAEGMWVEESHAGVRAAGDESPFVTLTRDLLRPTEKLLFVIGVPALGPGSYTATTASAVPFDRVRPDGSLVCYEVQSGVFWPGGSPRLSFLLALEGQRLRLERREDGIACDGGAASWQFGARAMVFVR